MTVSLLNISSFPLRQHYYQLGILVLTINPCRPCWITCANFWKAGWFFGIPHTLSLKRRLWLPYVSDTVIHYLTAVEILKKPINWKICARTSSKSIIDDKAQLTCRCRFLFISGSSSAPKMAKVTDGVASLQVSAGGDGWVPYQELEFKILFVSFTK